MPMHDWTRTNEGVYRHFRAGWAGSVLDALNVGGLPPGYDALGSQTVRPGEPDWIVTPRGRRPSPMPRGHQIAVYRAGTPGPVAVIEIMPLDNETGRPDRDGIKRRAVELLRAGVHVLVIDFLPPDNDEPNGIHATIWKELAGTSYTAPADRPLTVAAYAGGAKECAFVEPFAVGMPVPSMPLFLTADTCVTVPLDATYQAAWLGVPARYRTPLEAP